MVTGCLSEVIKMKCEDVLAMIDSNVQIVLYTCTGRVIKSGHKAELTRYGSWFVHGIYPHDSNAIDLIIDAEY